VGVLLASVLMWKLGNGVRSSALIVLGLLLAVIGVGDGVLKVAVGLEHSNMIRALTGLVGGFGLSLIMYWMLNTVGRGLKCVSLTCRSLSPF